MLYRIREIFRRKGYTIYTRPYQLNIVGLRSERVKANRFDDEIHVFYKTPKGRWEYNIFKATTDPGTFWLNNPSSPQGTAILAQGQYKNAYAIGLHAGRYEALVQVKPVTVIRDYNRDAFLDFNNGRKVKGLFGINIHHARVSGKTKYIDRYSAGCQVFADAGDFNTFMALCENHRNMYGNSFTYTLIDYRAIKRENLRRLAFAASVVTTLFLKYLFNYNRDNR